MRKVSGLLVIMLAGLASAEAGAQGYIGASWGKSDAGCASYGSAVACGEKQSTGWMLFGGYDFNEHLAIEGSHTEHGTFGIGFFGMPGFAPDGRATAITGKAAVVIGDRSSLFGKLGAAHWQFEHSTFGIGPQRETEGTDLTFAIGFEYIVNVLGVRLQWERTEFGRVDVDTASAGIVVKF